MSVTVRIPTPLRPLAGGQGVVRAEGRTVGEALMAIETQYPVLQQRVRGADGALRRFVNVYLNGEDIRFLQGEETLLTDGDEISIIPAIAGGAYG